MLGFRRFRIVERLQSVPVAVSASLLEEFRIHRVALVRFAFNGGFEILFRRADDRSLDLRFGRTSQLLDYGCVVGGMNFFRFGCRAKQAADYAVALLVSLFSKRQVTSVCVALSVKSGLQIFQRRRRGSSSRQSNQSKCEDDHSNGKLLHSEFLHFCQWRPSVSGRSFGREARKMPAVDCIMLLRTMAVFQ